MASEISYGNAAPSQLQLPPMRPPSKKWWFLLAPILVTFVAILFLFVEILVDQLLPFTKIVIAVSVASLIVGSFAGFLLQRLTQSNATTFVAVLAMSVCSALLVSFYNTLERHVVAVLESIPPQPGFPPEPPFQFPEVRSVWWIGIVIIVACCLAPQIAYLRKDSSALRYFVWYVSALLIFVMLSILAPFFLALWT